MPDTARTAGVAPSLESVLSTDELSTRPARLPDYEAENCALLAIARHMADSPQTALQKLTEVALEICRADSAGVSLISGKTGDFYWPAVAGEWKPYTGGGTPRHFGPCAVVVDRDAPQLFTHPERYYPHLIPFSPPIEEALLMPFHAKGKAIGAVWVIAHGDARKFDREDMRLMVSLGRFAAATCPLSSALDAEQQQSRSMREINEGLLVSSLHQHELTEIAQKAEAALRESEDRMRLAGSAAKVGTWRLDIRAGIESRDANMNRLLALEPVDSIQPAGDFLSRLHPDDRPLVEAEIEKSLRERGPYKIECRIILPNGTTRWLLNQGHAILSDGEAYCITGAAVDVTLQKGVERTLRMANEDLEQFGYSASHDLQEPIRNISVYGELLSKNYGHLLDARGTDFLATITGGARRMEMLLRDLRSYAQSGGTEDNAPEEVRADDALANALSDLSTAVGEAGAEVRHGELPTLCVHAVQLEQLFQNLVGNAIKYRRDGEPPRIYVAASLQHDEWIFSVSDNGIGIASEHQKRIFGIFKRLNNDAKYAGSGIGLAICQKIVERNGGRIWVESEGKGKGSTFYFTVPVREAECT
jgi:signal transduction histidine kinase